MQLIAPMFWIALAAAAQLNAPIPRSPWFLGSDTPVELLSKRGFAFLRYRVIVTPEGKVATCEIEQSSGDPKIDALTCNIIKHRARFLPAHSEDGTPVLGVYRQGMVWTRANIRVKHDPDLTVTVNRLPYGTFSPAVIALAIAVDETGHVETCNSGNPAIGRSPANPELTRIACEGLVKSYVALPATNDRGEGVRSVQTAVVSLVTQSAIPERGVLFVPPGSP